jgi:hypothetical protein
VCRVDPVLAFALALWGFGAAAQEPVRNPSPTDVVQVDATIPEYIAATARATWEATDEAKACKRRVPGAGGPYYFPLRVSVDLTAKDAGGKRFWAFWRDYYLPGKCRWKLREVYLWADRIDSGLPPDRVNNLPNRVAYVRFEGEPSKPNDWAVNDDNTKPVYRYCKFSPLKGVADGQGTNPCAYDWEKHRGTDSGKGEHLLLPHQHLVRLVVIDLENPPR